MYTRKHIQMSPSLPLPLYIYVPIYIYVYIYIGTEKYYMHMAYAVRVRIRRAPGDSLRRPNGQPLSFLDWKYCALVLVRSGKHQFVRLLSLLQNVRLSN